MNYIYDIVLNFHQDYYSFYEWKKNDEIINIKKIPLLKISTEDYLSLKYNEVTIDKELIESLSNLTLTYNRVKYEYACLVSNELEAMGLLFNKEGKLLKRSNLLLDEEEEVLEEVLKLKKRKIDFQQNILKKQPTDILRSAKEKKAMVANYLLNNNDEIILKYLYYEFYEKEDNNVKDINALLLKEIELPWDYRHNRLYEVIKMMMKIKN